MNRYVRRVFKAYLLALLAAPAYAPWYGRPIDPWADHPVVIHAPLWSPPRTLGYIFSLDAASAAFFLIALTAVLASALVALWGAEDG